MVLQVNKGSPPYRLYMDPKGALKIIDSGKGELWSSGTTDSHGEYVCMYVCTHTHTHMLVERHHRLAR